MCGIFVVIPKKENHDYFRAKIALDKLKKRGPDYNFIKIHSPLFYKFSSRPRSPFPEPPAALEHEPISQ